MPQVIDEAINKPELITDLQSPDGRMRLEVFRYSQELGRGVFRRPETDLLGYRLWLDDKAITERSAVGLDLAGAPRLLCGMRVEDVELTEADETYRPLFGEHAEHPAAYAQAVIQLAEQLAPQRRLTVCFRLYNGCMAIRYELPPQESLGPRISIRTDLTEFRFSPEAIGYECLYHEDEYRPKPLHEFCAGTRDHPGAWLPVTVCLPDGRCVCIAEADLRRGSQMLVKPAGPGSLMTHQHSPTVHDFANGPYRSAWRVMIVAENASGLIGRSYHLENLCPPPDDRDWSWVQPGSAIRDVTISTGNARECIDLASDTGMRYVLFDAGWYGAEPDEAADLTYVNPDLARLRTQRDNHEGFDLPAVVEHATAKGIGVFLYVNHRLAERQLEHALPTFKDWGIAGIKLGFVQIGHAEWTDWLLSMVERCADYGLMVNVHDAYRPTGLSRTYPNLLTQEGVRGNEHMPSAAHNASLPYTRFVSGAADYTLCFNHPRQQPTNAHQLALGIIFYSPYQMLYWYSRPDEVRDVPGREVWDNLPTTWDKTIGIDGKIGQYAVVARSSGGKWWLAAINGNTPRRLRVKLSFLEQGQYKVSIVSDAIHETDQPDRILQFDHSLATRQEELELDLDACSGSVAFFDPH